MSFGGFGGFGQNNNNQQSSSFGGFGNTNNTSTGFGSNTSTGFGSSTTSSNPFGGFGSNNTSGGFGSTTPSNSLFGNNANKTAFGTPASTGGSMFGSTPTGTTGTSGGFGGFGSNNNTTAASGGFSFGQQKPSTFGSGTTAGGSGSLFGSGGNASSGFGSSTSTPFGGSGTALAGQPVPPAEGTGSTPFAAFTEKEGTGPTNHFQSITFMQPYQKYSFEELRLADYNAGRKNASNGQPGAFGQSNGFGGFGAQSTGGFGSTSGSTFGGQNAASTPFGTSGTSTAFGAGGGTSGGLFGNKPATGTSMFGQTTSGTSSGGLFGSTTGGSTGTGFGFGNSSTPAAGGGGLFGGNTAAAKPAGFGTGTTSTGTGFGGGFGSTNTSAAPSGGLFGGATNTTGTGGGLFGQPAASTATQSGGLFGAKPAGAPGFGGFGATATSQPQTGGLFGSSNTGTSGGLFGSASQAQPSGGLFSNTASQPAQTGGLFGQAQPAQQSGGLFGAKPAGNAGFGGFGAAQPQQSNTGGLFGTPNNQQGSSLFGASAQKPAAGGSLFGSSFGASAQNQQPAGGSLFGGQQNSNSLFGASQQSQQSQQPQNLRASLLDGNPYGASSIWSGLPPATNDNRGPLVTPLSASQKLKESQSRPSFRYSPVSRLYNTPPRRGGYGFSYSTYGTPSSASSTPGTGSVNGRGFTGGSFGRSMTKSYSSTNLRQQFSSEGESLLTPGALAPGTSRYSSGSIRRLTIDRSLKTDLFSRSSLALPPAGNNITNGNSGPQSPIESNEPPQKLKKRVSFDNITPKDVNGNNLNGVSGALVRTETDDAEPAAEEQGFLRSSRRSATNGTTSGPENDTSRGKELAVVPEDRPSDHVISSMKMPHDAPAAADPQPGEYWMKPSRAELSKMPREKLQAFKDFTVGRQGCGSVTFNGPVDLTKIPLDDLYGKIIDIGVRSITVYPDISTKPPPGSGLNVPSTLRLENSWPRSRGKPSSATSGPLFDKHVKRLKEVKGTNYVDYETQTGIWTFTVPHYTRYGLDYDDDEEEEEESTLSSPPDDLQGITPTNNSTGTMELDPTPEGSSLEDDTFGYKKMLPGAFGEQPVFDEPQQSFLGDRSVAAESDVSDQSYEEQSDDEVEMAGSFPQPDPATELEDEEMYQVDVPHLGTPSKHVLDLEGDWAEQLQRTISPRKQDREALREIQSKVLIDIDPLDEPVPKSTTNNNNNDNKNEFLTSIDVMNSLFGQHEERMSAASKKQSVSSKGFEWPYPKRAKAFDGSQLKGPEQAWHASLKPQWTSTGQLIYKSGAPSTHSYRPWTWTEDSIFADGAQDIKIASLVGDQEESFGAQWKLPNVDIKLVKGIPKAQMKNVDFKQLVHHIQEYERIHGKTKATANEFLIWTCARILFEDFEDEFTMGLTAAQQKQFEHRIRKDRFCQLWELLILEKNIDYSGKSKLSPEAQAVRLLSVRDVKGACRHLLENGDYHLATLVAEMMNSDESFRENIQFQLATWRDQGVISEMTDEIRTIYELLAGNTTICEGKSNVPNEDRASTFVISERWDLDWLQAFGLVLFYGILQDDPIEKAISQYARNLESKKESAFPSLENIGDAGRIIPSDAESPFWVLLKLYAEMRGYSNGGEVILPQAISPLSRPFDCQFTFHLHHALAAHEDKMHVDQGRADQLAMDLAFQYSSSGNYLGAIHALLFLSNDQEREFAIKEILSQHAPDFPEYLDASQVTSNTPKASEWEVLESVLKVPRAWRCEAKALYCRAINKPILEFQYLLEAGLFVEAHDTITRRVAPKMIINQEFDRLLELLNLFGPATQSEGGPDITELIPNWLVGGGGVYMDFLSLITLRAGEDEIQHVFDPETENGSRARRLQLSLAEMGKQIKKRQNQKRETGDPGPMSGGGNAEEVLEAVACKEMGDLIANALVRAKRQNISLLNLPLSSNERARHTQALSMDYYRAIMAGAGR